MIRRFSILIFSILSIIALYLAYKNIFYLANWYTCELTMDSNERLVFEYLTDFQKRNTWKSRLYSQIPRELDWKTGITFTEIVMLEGTKIDYQVKVNSYQALESLHLIYTKERAFETQVHFSVSKMPSGIKLKVKHQTIFKHFIARAFSDFLEKALVETWKQDLSMLKKILDG